MSKRLKPLLQASQDKEREHAKITAKPLKDAIGWKERILKGSVHEREEAIKETAERKDPELVNVLIERIKGRGTESDGKTFYDAFKGVMLTDEQNQLLLSMLKKGNGVRQETVLDVLAECGDERCLQEVIAALEHTNRDVMLAAISAIGVMGQRIDCLVARGPLTKLFQREKDWDLRKEIVGALRGLGTSDSEIEEIKRNSVEYVDRSSRSESFFADMREVMAEIKKELEMQDRSMGLELRVEVLKEVWAMGKQRDIKKAIEEVLSKIGGNN
jgi:hypothetical protein